MDPVIRHWIDLWDYLDGNFWHVWQWAAQSLTPAQVGWQPDPKVASIGWNLQHLGEMLDYYLAHVFACGPAVCPGDLVTMRSGGVDDGRFTDLVAIAEYHKQVRPAYRRFLASLTAADFVRVLRHAGNRPLTVAWAVGHIAEHESYHLGKVTLLRNLLPR
ncbi:MAG: hypothetical protein KatS3mg105_2585 [Gemmatales bacterium]|nr:MAG: hypothetical protein KatS3mg105_2585 [Gemmatales bacterium]